MPRKPPIPGQPDPSPKRRPTPPRPAPRVLAMGAGFSWQRLSAVAAEEAVDLCGQHLADTSGSAGATVDLAIVFMSPHHITSANQILKTINKRLGARCLVGCSAESVIGGTQELEGLPGVSILAASLPGVAISPFCSEDLPPAMRRLPVEDTRLNSSMMLGGGGGDDDADAPPAPPDSLEDLDDSQDLAELADAVGMTPAHRATILFVEPFSTPLYQVLNGLARSRSLCSPGGAGQPPTAPGIGPLTSSRRGPILGGIASASRRPKVNAMLLNDRVIHEGIVGITLSGAIRIDPVVSQGCRPIGPPMIVTSAKNRVIRTIGGKPALQMIHKAIETLTERERRELLVRGLMIGRVVNEYKDTFGPSDYLMRAVTAVNKEEESILTSERIRIGQTVRFHVRDAEAADADLGMLMDAQALHSPPPPAGILLVSSNARGTRLFKSKDHDAQTIQRAFREQDPGETKARGGTAINPTTASNRPIPLAGFFAAGEIGPIGDEVFIHGQTCCAAVIRPG